MMAAVGLPYNDSPTILWQPQMVYDSPMACGLKHYGASISTGISSREKANSFFPRSFKEAPI